MTSLIRLVPAMASVFITGLCCRSAPSIRACLRSTRCTSHQVRSWRTLEPALATSPSASRLAPKPKVYAVDIEPAMIEHLRHRITAEGLTNANAIQAAADATNLPEPVDLALVVDTYHHIPNRVAYFAALKGRLKQGARLAIVDFRKGAPSGPPEEFRFTPDQIEAELAKAGFSLQTTHDFLPRQIFLIFTVN